MSLQVEYVSLDSVFPYENNAKIHTDEQIDEIANSIKEFGMIDPIGVWKNNEIIEGHGRLLACKKLGIKEVPIIRLDELTDEQRKAYALAHNKLTMNTDFDFSILNEELASLEDIDMSLFGFEKVEIEEPPVIVEDDFSEEAPPRTQRGQVWILGNHRLMCGDSSDEADMNKLFGGGYAKLVFTDPPYGVSIGDKNKALQSIQRAGRITENIMNDTLSTDELYELLLKAFSLLKTHCTDDCSYYVTSPQGGEIGLMMMMMMMRDAGLEVRHNLIWEKNSATFSMGRLDYDYQHEPIFYTWTKKHNYYGKGKYHTTIWKFDKPRKCDLHPTMKPIELIVEAILNSSQKGDPVADIFGGSGSTIIACEQTNRKCYTMELDPHYCDVIIERWENFTGKKAVLLNESE